MSANKVLMVHESIGQSVAKDAVSCISLLSTVGVGMWMGNDPVQWAAAIVWIVWLISHAGASMKDNVYSFDAARRKIDEWERSK